jgi:hypothetical protein
LENTEAYPTAQNCGPFVDFHSNNIKEMVFEYLNKWMLKHVIDNRYRDQLLVVILNDSFEQFLFGVKP